MQYEARPGVPVLQPVGHVHCTAALRTGDTGTEREQLAVLAHYRKGGVSVSPLGDFRGSVAGCSSRPGYCMNVERLSLLGKLV